MSEIIGGGGRAHELLEPLRLMRRYCVHFLERVGASEDRCDDRGGRRHLVREPRWSMYDYWFGEALGELRGRVGLQVAITAASYGLEVEDYLARTLPNPWGLLPKGWRPAGAPSRQPIVNRGAQPGGRRSGGKWPFSA